MIIILEGPDGSGKSYLSKQLMDRYGLLYHHEGPPPQDVPIFQYYASLLIEVVLAKQNIVLDRFALGERVYGPHYRGHDALGVAGWELMQRLMQLYGAFQILCLPPYKVCKANWGSGREELFKDENIFRKTFETYVDNIAQQYIYDYTKPGSLDDLFWRLDVLSRKSQCCGGLV